MFNKTTRKAKWDVGSLHSGDNEMKEALRDYALMQAAVQCCGENTATEDDSANDVADLFRMQQAAEMLGDVKQKPKKRFGLF